MSLKIRATNVFERNWNAHTRIVVNQGGSRSSKTYSICQMFILKFMGESGYTLSICRKVMPSLRSTVMRDFFEILLGMGVYDEGLHDKTNSTYKLNGNLIEFISMDQPQKKRGAKRHFLWMNEANEFNLEDFRQLNMRTENQVFLDFNPSDEFHWIYDQVLTREDVTFIKSTYKDNPFLPAALVKEIELYRDIDENYWKVYGLGERGASGATIYPTWHYCDRFPERITDYVYGLDFAYSKPTALIKVGIHEKDLYVEEVFYQTHLTDADTIQLMNAKGVSKQNIIYGDPEDPESIDALRKAGFNIRKAEKDVVDGIRKVKEYRIHIVKSSLNTIKEIQSYKWMVDTNEQPIDKPVKANDHSMDAMRYGVFTFAKKPTGKYNISNV